MYALNAPTSLLCRGKDLGALAFRSNFVVRSDLQSFSLEINITPLEIYYFSVSQTSIGPKGDNCPKSWRSRLPQFLRLSVSKISESFRDFDPFISSRGIVFNHPPFNGCILHGSK